MRLPTTPAWIKAALPVLIVLFAACAGPVAVAPFPERPDTVQPGSLRGPFDGQVVEQANGNGVPGALVVGSWGFERRGNVPLPLEGVTRSVVTGADGSYRLPSVPGRGGAVLARFTLVVYKAGFLGYRSDQRFEDRGRRSDFSQRRLTIRLERFPDGESHARHLVFLGGDGAVRRAAQAEVVQAALELSEALPARQPAPEKEPQKDLPPLPEARALLPQADIEALGKGVRFSAEPLPDQVAGERPGPTYDGVHYRAQGRAETFDAALRVWRPVAAAGAEGGTPAEALLQQLKDALPGAKEIAAPEGQKGDAAPWSAAVRAFDGKRRVYGAVALLKDAGLVVQIACGSSLCPREDAVIKLLTRAAERAAAPLEPAK